MTTTEALKMARDALALNADLDPQTPIVERLAKTRAALAAIDALQSTHPADASKSGAQIDMAQPSAPSGEPLRRGSTGVCSRKNCECERARLGNQCIWLRPTDAELQRRTGEPHIDGWPLYSGLPPPQAVHTAAAELARPMTERDQFDMAMWHARLGELADAYYEAGRTNPARQRARADLMLHALECATGWRTRSALAAHTAAARAVQAPAPSDMEDPVMVPRGLIGAACSALDFGREAPKTLAELRRYTIGDRSGPAAAAPQAQAVRAPNV